jgi:hypothetical protein
MGLIIWITIVICHIAALLAYMDDSYSFERAGNHRLYLPYGQTYPEKQTCLLELWDNLNIAHKKKKQEFGSVLGFEVDPNAMTITMPKKSLDDLISFLEDFLSTSS